MSHLKWKCYVRSSVKRSAKSGSVANRHVSYRVVARMHVCSVFRWRVQSEGGAAGSVSVSAASPYVAAQLSPRVCE